MSYDIIKSIRVIDNKVIVRAAANNVSPRDYEAQEAPGLTRIYAEQGEIALTLTVLREYECGNFQPYSGTVNKYVRAIDRLRQMPEYAEFDWRVPDSHEYEKVSANRKTRRQEFDALLLRAYQTEQQYGVSR